MTRGRKRAVGLLGLPRTGSDSDDDPDFQPASDPASDEDAPQDATPVSPPHSRRAAPRAARSGGSSATIQGAVGEEDMPLSQRRQQLQQQQQAAVRQHAAPSTSIAAAPAGPAEQPAAANLWASLPSSVLAHVFALACAPASVPAAAVVPCVCRAWRDAARAMPGGELWHRADCSNHSSRINDAVIAQYIASGRWDGLRKLKLAGCSGVSEAGLLAVGQRCRQLAILDLTGCQHYRCGDALERCWLVSHVSSACRQVCTMGWMHELRLLNFPTERQHVTFFGAKGHIHSFAVRSQAPLEEAIRAMTALRKLKLTATSVKPAHGGFDKASARAPAANRV